MFNIDGDAFVGAESQTWSKLPGISQLDTHLRHYPLKRKVPFHSGRLMLADRRGNKQTEKLALNLLCIGTSFSFRIRRHSSCRACGGVLRTRDGIASVLVPTVELLKSNASTDHSAFCRGVGRLSKVKDAGMTASKVTCAVRSA